MTERAVKSHDMERWSWSRSKCDALDGAAEGMREQKGCWIWGFPIRAQLLCSNKGVHPTAQGCWSQEQGLAQQINFTPQLLSCHGNFCADSIPFELITCTMGCPLRGTGRFNAV